MNNGESAKARSEPTYQGYGKVIEVERRPVMLLKK